MSNSSKEIRNIFIKHHFVDGVIISILAERVQILQFLTGRAFGW